MGGEIGVRPEQPYAGTLETTPLTDNVEATPVESGVSTTDSYTSADGAPASIRIDFGTAGAPGTTHENRLGSGPTVGLLGDAAPSGDDSVLLRDVEFTLWADPTGQELCGYDASLPY